MNNTQNQDVIDVNAQIDNKELLREMETLASGVIVSDEFQDNQKAMLEYLEQNNLYSKSSMNRKQKRNHFLKMDLQGDKSNIQKFQTKKIAKSKAKSKAAKQARKKNR